jgi:hypothetical protein
VAANTLVINLEIECSLDPVVLANWKKQAWDLIQSGYQAQLADYQAALNAQKRAIAAENPDFLRDAMSSQIVQRTVALLGIYATPRKTAGRAAKRQAEKFAPRVQQFLGNCFAWSDLDVQLYFDKPKKKSKGTQTPLSKNRLAQPAALDLFKPDLAFRNFLRATRARLLAVVRPEMARPLLYYLRTGQIWPEAPDLTPCLEPDIEIVAKLKADARMTHAHGKLVADWTVRVPSAMTVLQDPHPPGLKGEPK